MPAPCPDPEVLTAYQAGALDDAARESLERHGLDCRACREVLRLVGGVEGTEIFALEEGLLGRFAALRRRKVWSWRAAAAVLLALGAGWWLLQHPRTAGVPEPAAPELPAAAEGFPSGRLAGGGYVVQGADLLLGAAARAACEGRRLRPEAGTFWVEVSRGEPLVVDLPGAVVTLRQGALAVSLPALRTSWFLQDAFAAEEGAGVWVLEGEAEVEMAGKPLRLEAGSALHRSGAGWVLASASEQELTAFREGRVEAAAALPGTDLAPAGFRLDKGNPFVEGAAETRESWRWVTVLKGRTPTTELRFSLPAGGVWRDWTAGLAALPPRPTEVVEIVWDGERLRGRVNGQILFSLDRERLGKELLPSARDAWALSVWGGSVTVAKSVLR